MFDIKQLNNESEGLPVKAHTEVYAEQFLASGYRSHRADHKRTSSTSFCLTRHTLNDSYRYREKQHTNNNEKLSRKEYETALKSINRHTVQTQLNQDRKQLSTLPPKIAEEQTLPRIARIRLAQLRTGYCPLLNSYLSRIFDNVDNRCRKCDVAPHDVNHIVN